MDLCWRSPHMGGVGISWTELMGLSIQERDFLAERVKELKEFEIKIANSRLKASSRF